jgi:exonuclease SbcC
MAPDSKRKTLAESPETADDVSRQIAELERLMQNVRTEKAALHTLLASVEEKHSFLAGEQKEVSDLKGELGNVQDGCLKLKSQLDQMHAHVLDAKETLTNVGDIEERVGALKNKLEHISDQEKYVEQLNGKVDTVVEKIDRHSQNGLLQDGIRLAGELETNYTKLTDQYGKLMQSAERIVADMTSIRGELSSTKTETDALATRISDFQQEVNAVGVLKSKIDNLNSLSELVNRKIKALENQRAVVEKANEDAARLNTLMWDADFRLNQLNGKFSHLQKTEKNIERIRGMLEESKAEIRQLQEAQTLIHQIADANAAARTLFADLDGRLELLRGQNAHLEEIGRKVKEVYTASRTSEAILNTILKHKGMLEESNEAIRNYEHSLEKMKEKIEELHEEWKALDAIKERIGLSEARLEKIEARLDTADEKEKEIGAFELKLQEIRSIAEEACSKEETFQGFSRNADDHLKRVDQFMERADTLEQQITELRGREQDIQSVVQQFEQLQKLAATVIERSEQTSEKMALVQEVDKKVSDLGSTVTQIDDRMNIQLERKTLIDNVEKRLDQLNYLAGDINLKIQNLTRDQHMVRTLEQELAACDGKADEARAMMDRLEKERDAFEKQQQHIAEARKTMENLQATTRSNFEAFKAQIAAAGETAQRARSEFTSSLDHFSNQMKALSGERQAVTKAADELKRVEKVQQSLKAEAELIERRIAKVASLDTHIDQMFTNTSEMEKRIEQVQKNIGVIDEAQQKIDLLTGIVAKLTTHIESIEGKLTDVERVERRVNAMDKIMETVEKKMRDLAAQQRLIKEGENRLHSLNILVEEIKAQMERVAEEERSVKEVAQQITELRFLLSDTEAKIALLKRERDQL